MAEQKTKSKGGGSKKIGRDTEKCKQWRARHDPRSGENKKFAKSKEKRGCGPIGYYLRGLDKTSKKQA